MEGFSVRISGLNQRLAEEESFIRQLKDLEKELESIKGRINFQVRGRAGITRSLDHIGEEFKGYISDVNEMKRALDNICSLYQASEKKNSTLEGIPGARIIYTENSSTVGGKANVSFSEESKADGVDLGFAPDENYIEAAIDIGEIFGLRSSVIAAGAILNEDTKTGAVLGLGEEMSPKLEVGKYKQNLYKKKSEKGIKGEITAENGQWKVEKERYDTSEKKKEQDEKKEIDDKKKAKEILENITIASVKKDFVSATLWKGGFETEHLSGDCSASEFKVDGKAYLTAAGAGAEIGAAYTALQCSLDGKIGDDNFGVHGSGDVIVGKVGANAGIELGWLDEDGNFALNAGVKGEAEAVLFEANVTGGMDLLGTDIDVTGGVTFGVGAHANIGFYDGKFKFDVGAAAGIGLNVDLEIDVSKSLEYISDIGKGISDTMEKAGDLWNKGIDIVSGWFDW